MSVNNKNIPDKYKKCTNCGSSKKNWFDLFENNSIRPVFQFKCNICGCLLDSVGRPQ